MKRDKLHHHAQLAFEDEPEDVMLADEDAPDPHEDAEAYECFMADQALIESALEVIQEKKCTLKEKLDGDNNKFGWDATSTQLAKAVPPGVDLLPFTKVTRVAR